MGELRNFDPDFVDHLLQAAKKYMSNREIQFSKITNSIEILKQRLLNEHQTNAISRNRDIEEVSDNDFVIKVNLQSTPKTPKTLHNRLSFSSNRSHLSDSGDSSSPRIRTKKFTYNIQQTELRVLVTTVYKFNCAWVREIEKNSLLAEIQMKSNKEGESKRNISDITISDKMYLAKNEGEWARCKIHKTSPLIVTFIDYGKRTKVNELRDISLELSEISPLALRITFKETDINLDVGQELVIKPFNRNSDGTLFVNIISTQKIQEKTFFNKPPFMCSMTNNQNVCIFALKDGIFYLRTKECFEKEREIDAHIAKVLHHCGSLSNVQKDQLVLVKNSEKFRRGRVLSVSNKKVEVEFLDFFQTVSVDLSDLRNITQSLSEEVLTYFGGGKLVGFEEKKFSEKQEKYILDCIEQRRKYIVDLGFDDEFDLYDGKNNLSSELQMMENKYFLCDVKHVEPKLGTNSYVCSSYKNTNDLTLVPLDLYQKQKEIMGELDIPDVVYAPTVGEVCICNCDGDWLRCVVTKILPKNYEAISLDFGTTYLVETGNVRQANSKFFTFPALALPATLIDLPQIENIEIFLRKSIIVNEIYEVNVIQIANGKCQVKIPSIWNQINNF